MPKKVKSKLPKFLKGYFWSVKFDDIDINKDKDYIIHQVLCFGDLNSTKWLFKTYGKNYIRKSFINKPTKIYRPQTFNWVKNILLSLDNKQLDFRKYVINTPRSLR